MRKMKRILATLLALIMLISVTPVLAEETDITVYVSISKYGEILTGANGAQMAYAPVTLSGQDSYNVDDALREAHRLYCPDGIDGYASSVSDWGLGVDILWGDTSYNFGYYINGSTSTLLGDAVLDGTYIDAFIYENIYTEKYSAFNLPEKEVDKDEEFELEISQLTYDENWNPSYSLCSGATVTVNGEATEYITDENGCVTLSFSEPGRYIVSAYKDETITDEEGEEKIVPTITAPVCVVIVACSVSEIIHNIAAYYKEVDLSEAGGNLPWIVADMMMYEELFPESENVLTTREKLSVAELIVADVKESERPGDMAKAIIALSSLGYDAEKIITEDYENINLAERLTDLIDDEDSAVTNIYTLPYVMIALSQKDKYATEEQREYLLNAVLESTEEWQDTTYGTDAMTPMILALSPYYNSDDEVKAVIDGTVEILKVNQREDGLIDGPHDYQAASTGLAIAALSAIGNDPDLVVTGENSLIDGMLSTVNKDGNGFANAFATEQGFRGLLGWMLLGDKVAYDFSNYEKEKLNLSQVEYCPVMFEVSPKKAEVLIDGVEPISDNLYDLSEGIYSYTVYASDYKEKSGTIKVTEEDAENNILKKIEVSLTRVYSGGGSSSSGKTSYSPEVETEDTPNKSIFSENVFLDVSKEDWFYNAVEYVCENNLFKGTDKGFEPDSPMTRAMIVTVLYRMAAPDGVSGENPYTDVLEKEWYTDAVKWTTENQIVTGVSADRFAPDENVTREQLATILYRYAKRFGYDVSGNADLTSYSDYTEVSEYAVDGIGYFVKIGVMTGRTADSLVPKGNATRAEVATMIMRFAEVL